MSPIDENKVTKFLEDWNKNLGREQNPLWIAIEGVSTLGAVTVSDDETVTFNANKGYLVKGFLNKETGEVKTFTIQLFTRTK